MIKKKYLISIIQTSSLNLYPLGFGIFSTLNTSLFINLERQNKKSFERYSQITLKQFENFTCNIHI